MFITEVPSEDGLTVLRVADPARKTSCLIPEELRTAVYLSADEKTIVVHSYSGSMGSMGFYRARDCKKRERLPAREWKVERDRLTDEGGCDCDEAGITDKSNCECWPARVYRLDKKCRPKLLRGESSQLTKKIFNVAFSKKTRIAHPRTKKAKLINRASR